MKKLWIFLSMVLISSLMLSCSKETRHCNGPSTLPVNLEPIVVEPSMKGWELYSWQEDKQGCTQWNYVLMQGTARLKSYNEVTNDAILHVTGEQQLNLLLNKFPKKEQILWMGENWLSNIWGASQLNIGSLQLPPSAVKNAVLQHCLLRELELSIAP